MITLDMIKRGYDSGIIKLIESPDDGWVVCGIGDNYFYFGAGELKPDEFLAQVTPQVFLKEIFEVLDKDFRGSPEFDDEYRYYEAFLDELLKEIPNAHSITLDMVKRGYEAGLIKVEASVISGISCEIQDMNLRLSTELAFDDFMHWNAEHIVERVFNYLKNEVKKEDYLYVERVLNEGLKELPVESLQDLEVVSGRPVQLSHSDGTWLAESMVASAVRYMEHAREMVSKINEGTYERGQAPLRFDCETSPELAGDMRDLVNVFWELVEAVGMDSKALAAQFVQGNPSLAGEIYRLVDKDNYKEDIIGKLEDMGIDVESLTDAEIRKMSEQFEKTLSNNDGYWDSYWLSAEAAIDEVLKEKVKAEEEKALAWNTVDEMVDLALPEIKGVGEWAGSGLYGLRDFEVDGERMELVVELCRFEDKDENRSYYGVYYWVGYYGGDSLFADWKYTSELDVDELKEVVRKLENTDFTEDILKAKEQNSVDRLLSNAEERCETSDVKLNFDYVME